MDAGKQTKSEDHTPNLSSQEIQATNKINVNTNLALHAQRDSQHQWNISKQEQRPKESELLAKQVQFQVPLPKGDGLVVRLREDVHIESDGSASLRVVYKFPGPDEDATMSEKKQATMPSQKNQQHNNRNNV